MAIWQYKLKVIPKESVVKKFGTVPTKLEINHKDWENHWQKRLKGIKSAHDFEDAHTINWWENVHFDKAKIILSINNLVKQCNWSNAETVSWKGDTYHNEDNDVYIHFDKSEKVVEFTFRTDLRNGLLDFLAEMLEICKKNEWLVMDVKGYLMNPNLLDVYDSVRNSDTTKFLEDPEKFFEDLNSKIIKPE
jgi:hypothetical protein